MKSRNFEVLRKSWPELSELGAFAEAYAHDDPARALVKLRLLAENLTKDIYRDLGLPKPEHAMFVDLLSNESSVAITPKVVLDKLHVLRIHGNKAAHGEPATARPSTWLLREAFDLGRWLFVQYGNGDAKEIPPFEQPTPDAESKGRLKQEKRQALEKLAAQEAQMQALLDELEAARLAVATAERRADEIAALASSSAATASLLNFNKATTRARIIDSLLASAGWDVAPGNASTEQVGKEVAVQHQPTSTSLGYADDVLWDDNGAPIAVIEAKRTAVDPEHGRQQAKLYADAWRRCMVIAQ
jgi:type I restriction enzyme R subunit